MSLVSEEVVACCHSAADIDGYGDEGAGYDYSVFAKCLRENGWSFDIDKVPDDSCGLGL